MLRCIGRWPLKGLRQAPRGRGCLTRHMGGCVSQPIPSLMFANRCLMHGVLGDGGSFGPLICIGSWDFRAPRGRGLTSHAGVLGLRSRRYTGTVRTVKVKNMLNKWTKNGLGNALGNVLGPTNAPKNAPRSIFCIYWSICWSQSIPQSISQTIFGPFVERFFYFDSPHSPCIPAGS